MNVSRRRLLKLSAAGASVALGRAATAFAQEDANVKPQQVAAIQFTPKIGDIGANLTRVDALVKEALNKGAQWVVLPEFFSTGTALHPALFAAHEAVDGRASKLLRDLAALGHAYVGGTFLAQSAGDVFNTFALACPDGTLLTHDKDFPTQVFESAYYAGGEDAAYRDALVKDGAHTSPEVSAPRVGNTTEGVWEHAGWGIGASLCWEMVRNRTAKRLQGKVDIVLASSGWWTTDPDQVWPGLPPSASRSNWTEHQALIKSAPQHLARMVGAPVVHANFVGNNPGYAGLSMDKEAQGRYLGNSQIIDAQGNVLASLGAEQGTLHATLKLGRIKPTEPVTDDFWHSDVSATMRRRWANSGAQGRDYYIKETRKRLVV